MQAMRILQVCLYDISVFSVSRIIKSLEQNGAITIKQIKDNKKTVIERRLYITYPIDKNSKGDRQKAQYPIDENSKPPIAENSKDNNTSMNNTRDNINIPDFEKSGDLPSGKSAVTKKHFQKPTVDEIRAYCNERGNGIDAQAFFDFYESKGWLIGKNKMKDWRASVRTWERNSYGNSAPNMYRCKNDVVSTSSVPVDTF